jgi:lipoprotein-anchoring transpeptidase ErfK/SrfK
MNRPANQATTKTLLPTLARRTFLLALITLSTGIAAGQSSSALQSKPATKPARRIVVSFPDRKLALLEGDRITKIYDVAVGAPDSPSPSGEFQIAQRLENPTYYKPGVVIGPGENNPLGPRWIGLNVKGFGIHGTNQPNSIGKNASHGCIRLRNSDIKDLFARVQVGDHVSLVSERTDEVARLFGASPIPNKSQETLQAESEAAPALQAQGNR